MWNKIKIGIFALITMFATILATKLREMGFDTMFTTRKWILREDRVSYTGTLQSTKLFFGDGDMCMFVKPDLPFQHLAANRDGRPNPDDGAIECEIEILDKNELDYLHMSQRLVGQPVTVSGVYVDDRENPDKSELHAVDALYGELPDTQYTDDIKAVLKTVNGPYKVYGVLAGSDDSWFQMPQNSWHTRTTTIKLPFPHKPIETVTGVWRKEYKMLVIQDVATTYDFMSEDTEDLSNFVLVVTPKSYKNGGPGVFVAVVIVYWVYLEL